MADKSAISWTDATWNCIRGCTRVDADCENCYAELLAATRLAQPRADGTPGPYAGTAVLTKAGRPHWTGVIQTVDALLDQPLRWQKPRRIFVASMSDPGHPGVPDAWLARMWAVMTLAHWHTFQLLTKRPERLAALLHAADFAARVRDDIVSYAYGGYGPYPTLARHGVPSIWHHPQHDPAPHIWLGTSAGHNGAQAIQRVRDLAEVPARVRFVSVEPLHGPVDQVPLEEITRGGARGWVITGGESGPRARPFDPQWAEDVRARCAAAGIAYYHKQNGGPTSHSGGHLLNGVQYQEYPV